MSNKICPSWFSNDLNLIENLATKSVFPKLNKKQTIYFDIFDYLALFEDYLPSISKEIEVHVFCGSHGVEKYNISAINQEYVKNQYKLGKLKKSVGGSVAEKYRLNYRVWDCGLDNPTKDILTSEAMTIDECNSSLLIGWNAIKRSNAKVIALGELGACNTTSSAALLACILNLLPTEVIGRGSGIDDDRLIEKTQIISKIFDRYFNQPLTSLDLLYKIGGREIAALTGAIFRAAFDNKLLVLDGFVTCIAALIVRNTLGWTPMMFCPSKTAEPGQFIICNELKLNTLIDLNHTSGDGVGASIGSTLLLSKSKFHIKNELISGHQFIYDPTKFDSISESKSPTYNFDALSY